MAVELTRLSERGQIVIPSEIRINMHLKEGERFIVMGIEDTIVLRKLDVNEERLKLKDLIQKSRKGASKIGFSDKEIERLVTKTRKAIK